MVSTSQSSARLPYGSFFGDDESRREIQGFSLARMTPVLAPEDVPLHTHEQASFVLVLSGAYITAAQGAASDGAAPQLIYNPPGTTHRDRFKTMAGRFLAISVSAASLRRAEEYAALPRDAVNFTSRETLAIAKRLTRELNHWDGASPLFAEGACLELIALVARKAAAPRGQPPHWFAPAKEFLRDNCAEHVRIVDAAGAIGVHPVYFARAFRKFLRCTPAEYVNRCRLNKAAALLKTDAGLAEIALEAGFSDQSHFAKSFKRTFGVTPGFYRRMWRSRQVQISPFGSDGTRIQRRSDEILG
jgi:AraC family transcriptional regulator